MYSRKVKIRFYAAAFVCFAVIVSGVLLYPIITSAPGISVEHMRYDKQANAFVDVGVKIKCKNGKDVHLVADTVKETGNNTVLLSHVSSTMALTQDDEALVVADYVDSEYKNNTKCKLRGNVKFTTKSGVRLDTQFALVDFKNNIINGDQRVTIVQDKTELSGDSFHFDVNKYKLILTGNARGITQSSDINAEKITIVFARNGEKVAVKEVNAEGNAVLLHKNKGKEYKIFSINLSAFVSPLGEVMEVYTPSRVKIKTDTGVIRANSGIFKDGIVSVCGNVSVLNEYGNIFGEKAALNLNTGEMTVEKSSGVIRDGKK